MDVKLRSHAQRTHRRIDANQNTARPAASPRARFGFRWSWKKVAVGLLAVFGAAVVMAAAAVGLHFHGRYDVAETMHVPLEEVTTAEYPEDPAGRSVRYGQYNGRRLKLVQRDDRHFDFILEPTEDYVARIVFKDIDVSLMTPNVPEWCKEDAGLTQIALVDREWNRQQVFFDVNSEHVEVSGGDGFEVENLHKIALAKNCLNAGLWEVILNVKEDGGKSMYYQG